MGPALGGGDWRAALEELRATLDWTEGAELVTAKAELKGLLRAVKLRTVYEKSVDLTRCPAALGLRCR